MSLKLPSSVSKYLVVVVMAGTAFGVFGLLYQRHVLGNPFVIQRDAEGVLRWKTRIEDLAQKAAALEAELQAHPDSQAHRFRWAAAQHVLDVERARLVAAGQALKELTDDDLR